MSATNRLCACIRVCAVRLVVLAAGALLASGCAARAVPTGPHITVLTYNVNAGVPAPAAAVDAILAADADIVCLQETNLTWEAFLRLRLSNRYKHMLFRHADPCGGQAVLSRWPVAERAFVQPNVEGAWFPGWVLTAETSIGPMQILNVHLRPQLAGLGKPSLGALLTTQKVRAGEIQALCRQLDEQSPAIVLGDFNEGDDGAAVRYLRKRGMTDALGQFDWFTNTWRWRYGLIRLRKRFDRIMYSKHFRCLDARVIKKGYSDHFPVVAILEKQHQQ